MAHLTLIKKAETAKDAKVTEKKTPSWREEYERKLTTAEHAVSIIRSEGECGGNFI